MARLVFPFSACVLVQLSAFAAPSTAAADGAAPGVDPATALRWAGDADAAVEFAYPIFDRPGDGAIWVHGSNYKARFDRRGLEFIPFLGADAAHDYPVDFELGSAGAGTSDLAWARNVEPELDGNTVIYRRSALDEIYVVGRDSIEQTFLIREAPAAGDLHVSVLATTDLGRSESPLGTRFANERGGVQFGKAATRDACGRHMTTASALHGEAIEIVVPQSALRRSQFPLLIDPLIATWQVSDNVPGQAINADVAYDLTYDRWIAVYETAFSGSDHDVIAREYRGNGANVNQSTYIDMTTSSWTEPRVANSRISHQFLVVATVNQMQVWGRTRDAGSPSMGTQFQIGIDPNGLDSHRHPDVGGDPRLTAMDNYLPIGTFCVAWQAFNGTGGDHYSLNRTCVSPTGQILLTPLAVLPFQYSDNPNFLLPRLAKCCAADSYYTEWPMVFERGTLSAPGLIASTLSDQFTGGGLQYLPLASGITPTQLPAVTTIYSTTAGPRRCLVSWVDAAGQACGQMGDFQNSTVWTLGPEAEIDPTPGHAQRNICLAHDGSRFVLSYDQAGTFPDTNAHVYMGSVAPDPTGLTFTRVDRHVLISDNTKPDVLARIASMNSTGSASRNCLCVYQAGTVNPRLPGPVVDATLFSSN